MPDGVTGLDPLLAQGLEARRRQAAAAGATAGLGAAAAMGGRTLPMPGKESTLEARIELMKLLAGLEKLDYEMAGLQLDSLNKALKAQSELDAAMARVYGASVTAGATAAGARGEAYGDLVKNNMGMINDIDSAFALSDAGHQALETVKKTIIKEGEIDAPTLILHLDETLKTLPDEEAYTFYTEAEKLIKVSGFPNFEMANLVEEGLQGAHGQRVQRAASADIQTRVITVADRAAERIDQKETLQKETSGVIDEIRRLYPGADPMASEYFRNRVAGNLVLGSGGVVPATEEGVQQANQAVQQKAGAGELAPPVTAEGIAAAQAAGVSGVRMERRAPSPGAALRQEGLRGRIEDELDALESSSEPMWQEIRSGLMASPQFAQFKEDRGIPDDNIAFRQLVSEYRARSQQGKQVSRAAVDAARLSGEADATRGQIIRSGLRTAARAAFAPGRLPGRAAAGLTAGALGPAEVEGTVTPEGAEEVIKAAPGSAGLFRDVTDPTNPAWAYRQYADGRVEVISGPAGASKDAPQALTKEQRAHVTETIGGFEESDEGQRLLREQEDKEIEELAAGLPGRPPMEAPRKIARRVGEGGLPGMERRAERRIEREEREAVEPRKERRREALSRFLLAEPRIVGFEEEAPTPPSRRIGPEALAARRRAETVLAGEALEAALPSAPEPEPVPEPEPTLGGEEFEIGEGPPGLESELGLFEPRAKAPAPRPKKPRALPPPAAPPPPQTGQRRREKLLEALRYEEDPAKRSELMEQLGASSGL